MSPHAYVLTPYCAVSFLSEHGGYSNAFTSASDTNYYFEVSHEHLEGALDIFTHFFYTPLFNQSCTDRYVTRIYMYPGTILVVLVKHIGLISLCTEPLRRARAVWRVRCIAWLEA